VADVSSRPKKSPGRTGAQGLSQSLGMSLDACESMAGAKPSLPPFGGWSDKLPQPQDHLGVVFRLNFFRSATSRFSTGCLSEHHSCRQLLANAAIAASRLIAGSAAPGSEARPSALVVQKIVGSYDLLRIAKSKTRNQPAKGPEDGGPNNQKWKAAIAAFAASVGAGDVGGR